MRLLRLLFVVALNVLLMQAGSALANKRVALVIGNSNYIRVSPLPNPERDATAVAALFRAAGFETVEARSNLGTSEMRRALRDFADRVYGADIAVMYYAGHGIEVDGMNYLIPVDAALTRDIDVDDEAVSLERVLKLMEPAKKLRLVILDACRDNPFAVLMRRLNTSRTVARGLARVEPDSSNTLVAFAAKAGSTASDGDAAAHSPFTASLLKNIATPGLDLRLAFGLIRDDVLASTSGRQEPFVYGSLGGGIVSLVPGKAAPAATAPAATAPAATAPAASPAAAAPLSPPDKLAAVRRDYENAAAVATVETWDAFLAIHSTGFYADLARAQRSRLVSERLAKTATEKEKTEIAGLQPQTASSPPKVPLSSPTAPAVDAAEPALSPAQATEQIAGELKRLGCYAGQPTGVWTPALRRAMEQFNRHAGLKLETQVASLDSVDVMRAKSTRVCPLQCNRGFRASGDACVRIACPRGSVLVNGECERRPQSRDAARPPSRTEGPAARPAQRDQGAPASVVCGQTGCIPVRKGCRSELRASGNDSVAVVICN